MLFIVGVTVLSAGIPAVIMFASGEMSGAILTVGIGLLSFAFIWFLFLRRMVREARVLKTGEPATAVIQDVNDTGVTINDNPLVKLTLEVQPRRGPKYRTEAKVLVSRLNPAAYRLGMTIEVKIDPKDSMYVAVDHKKTMAPAGFPSGNEAASSEVEAKRALALEKVLRANDDLYKELAVSGEACEGTILNSWPLGANINNEGVAMEFLIEVALPGVETFTAELKGVIRMENVYKFSAGRKVKLLYDPDDMEGRIVIAGSVD